MSSPARRLAELGLSAKKSLGQHFLHDRAIIERICDVASIPSEATVVEIGPGLGVLTEALSTRARRVVALEKDETLAGALSQAMPENVDVRTIDALEFAHTCLESGFILVGNLPYNVATAILRSFLDSPNPPSSCTFMVQREVAERMVARPPEMNILAVAMQLHGEPKIAFHIGRGAFTPPPRVQSSVVHMEVTNPFNIPQSSLANFFELVRAGFSARRKQLRNSLINGGFEREDVGRLLEAADIDESVRPQELSVPDWVRLYGASRDLDIRRST